jgi:hypothetical protein
MKCVPCPCPQRYTRGFQKIFKKSIKFEKEGGRGGGGAGWSELGAVFFWQRRGERVQGVSSHRAGNGLACLHLVFPRKQSMQTATGSRTIIGHPVESHHHASSGRALAHVHRRNSWDRMPAHGEIGTERLRLAETVLPFARVYQYRDRQDKQGRAIDNLSSSELKMVL